MKKIIATLLLVFLSEWILNAQAPGAENLYEKYNNAVVKIYSFPDGKMMYKQGSGVIVKSLGWIITNHHVVEKGVDVFVEHEGNYLKVDDIVADDPVMDIFIFHYSEKDSGNTKAKIPDLKLVKKEAVKIGQRIYAIGSPFGLENTITEGLVSGIRKGTDSTREYIQISAPISQGSSGGAIINSKGELVGISSMLMLGETAQNLNFAIPIYEIVTLATKEPNEITLAKKANIHFNKGNNDFLKGDYSSAIYHFKKTIELESEKENEQTFANFNLGLAYSRIGKDDSADYFFNRSLLATTKKQDLLSMGEAFYKGHLYRYSLRAYEKVLEADSVSAESLIGASSSAFELKLFNKSYDYANKVIFHDENNADAWYIMGNLDYGNNKPDEALACFEKAVKNNPDLALAWLGMALIYKQKGELEKSSICRKKAYAIEPQLRNKISE